MSSNLAWLMFFCMGALVLTQGIEDEACDPQSDSCAEDNSKSDDEIGMLQVGVKVKQQEQADPDDANMPKEETLPLEPEDLEMMHADLEHYAEARMMDTGSLNALESILGQEVGKGDKDAEKALKDMVQAASMGLDPAKLVVGPSKDHAAVMKALEQAAVDTSPEDELKKTGKVITAKMLRQLDGLPDTPEQTPPSFNETKDVVEGDIVGENASQVSLIQEMEKAGVRFTPNLWKDKMNIPYCFATGIAPTSKKAFQDAVQHYKDHIPCLGFKEVAVGSDADEKCATQPGIYVKSNGGGCYANVGQPYKYRDGSYGRSVCHLQPDGCDTVGIAAHEIGHNIGMLHEQSRTDHSYYVTILWDNIDPAKKNQYDLQNNADTDQPYDVMSLMHYGDDFFAKPGKKTMVFNGASNKPMGNRQGLTMADAKQVATSYGCLNQLKKFEVCTMKEDGCTTNANCMCHQNTGFQKIVKGKSATQGTCYQCAKICPSYPSGTSGYCGCSVGCKKGCFTSGGRKYCYCKDCTPVPAPSPFASPTPAPPTPAPTTTKRAVAPPTRPPPPATNTCSDRWGFCSQYKDYCSPYSTLNDVPIQQACPKTCCMACAKCPPTCKDQFSKTCRRYGTKYCKPRVFFGFKYYTKISGVNYGDACKKTCGKC